MISIINIIYQKKIDVHNKTFYLLKMIESTLKIVIFSAHIGNLHLQSINDHLPHPNLSLFKQVLN